MPKRKSKRTPVRACKVCACTDADACLVGGAGSCHWVEPALCCACSPIEQRLRAVSLTFNVVREYNEARCSAAFHPLAEWSPTDWATAMAGECGEACNLIKKLRRGEAVPLGEVADELADLVIYTDLLAARLGIDLATAIVRKFNEVSVKKGSPLKL